MSLVGASLIGVFASQEVALGEPSSAEVTDGTVKKYPGREVVISVLVAYGSGSSPQKRACSGGPFQAAATIEEQLERSIYDDPDAIEHLTTKIADLESRRRRDAPARLPSQGGCPGLLRRYDDLERGRWNVAQSVLVDVDALDDAAILGAVHDLVLRVLGLVQRQSQLFHRFHLLVVRGTYPPKRVVYIEHNTNPEGGAQRPKTTG